METVMRIALWVLTAVVGLCVGSFLNVVVYRLPEHMSLAKPASHCPGCGAPIKWYDNIPVLSYLLLGGKCRHCKCRISPRYLLVELLNAVLWLFCYWRFGAASLPYAVLCMAVCSVFICVALIDFSHRIIFDRFQLILLGLGLIALFLSPRTLVMTRDELIGNLIEKLIGGVVGYGSFLLIGLLVGKVMKTEALGGGDVKLAGVAGLFLGWQKLILGVMIASVGMIFLIGILRRVRGDERGREYPFAPFLAIGFTASMLAGDLLIELYTRLLYLV